MCLKQKHGYNNSYWETNLCIQETSSAIKTNTKKKPDIEESMSGFILIHFSNTKIVVNKKPL
jgi:hypothetical protein